VIRPLEAATAVNPIKLDKAFADRPAPVAEGPRRIRVAAVVLNKISHDARVLKEAASLQRHGYEVTVFGICADNNTLKHEQLTNEVVLRRVDWQQRHLAIAVRFYQVIAVLSVLSAIGMTVAWNYFFSDKWPVIFNLDLRKLSSGTLLIAILLAFTSLFVVQFAYRRLSKLRRKATVADRKVHPSMEYLLNKFKKIRAKSGWIRRLIRMDYLFNKIWKFRANFSGIERHIRIASMRLTLIDAVSDFKPDIVHCHDLSALPVGVAIKKEQDCLLVYDSHEINEAVAGTRGLRRLRLEFLQRRCSRFVDAFITINESIAKYLGEKYPKLPKAVILMNATLPDDGNQPEYDGRLHRAAAIDLQTKILLYQGGFSGHRGLEKLVTGAAGLPSGWILVMMGWGSLEPKLRKIAKTVDPNGEKVRFIPAAPQPELALWTAGGTVGVIPYENVCLNHWYCTPNKLWEYPIAGVPILASPFPELKRIVEGEGVGWSLGEPFRAEDLIDLITGITETELTSRRIACQRFIATNHWLIYERRLVDLYGRLTANRTSAA
jgi:glycosyltransferase involved in cell wall biosynthesis